MSEIVTLIDYGASNLLSVSRALEYLGAEVVIVDKPEQIQQARKLVLPGVGAFADGMAALATQGLIEPIRDYVDTGRPFLGICLGMQMLFETSEEFGVHAGLGLIPGKIAPIPRTSVEGASHKIPHIGWNSLVQANDQRVWHGTILDQLDQGDAVYFVHSFAATEIKPEHLLANCLYGGHSVAAVVNKANVHGCQFHPEKSGEVGLKILKGFLQIDVE